MAANVPAANIAVNLNPGAGAAVLDYDTADGIKFY
jgi:hypothetical protein